MTVDTVAADIEAPAEDVFAFMSDPEKLTLWSFGTWETVIHADGLIEGRALQSGAPIWLRIEANAPLRLIDYHLGAAPDRLAPRIFTRVTPGEALGLDPGCCRLLMTGLRAADMDDERWARLRRAHAFEVDVIKSLIETGHDHRCNRTG